MADLGPGQRRRLLRDYNACVRGLNYLHGGDRRDAQRPFPNKATAEKMASLRQDVQQRVLSAARRWVDVDSAVHSNEALASFCEAVAATSRRSQPTSAPTSTRR